MKQLITEKDQRARLPFCPVFFVVVKFSSLTLPPGITLIPLSIKHQRVALVTLTKNRVANQQLAYLTIFFIIDSSFNSTATDIKFYWSTQGKLEKT